MTLGPGIAYSRLLRLRTGPDVALPSMEPRCDLCSSWEHPDPLTYVFQLRPDARWQDIPQADTRPVTAADVAFSLDRLRTPGWPGAALLDSVDSVEATGDLTLTLTLKYQDSDLLLALANGQSKVVAPEVVSSGGDLINGPTIGTGPWVLRSDGLRDMLFEANPAYYEPGLPGLQSLRIAVIESPDSRLAAVLAGRVDLTPLDIAALDRLAGSQPLLRWSDFPQQGSGIVMGLKASRPPFDRLEVRQAFFQALDPWRALEQVWDGQGSVGVGVPAVSSDWLLPDQELAQYLADSNKSVALLGQASVRTPVQFTLTVADYGDRHLALGDAFKGMLDGVGFQASIETLNPREYVEELWRNGDFDAFIGPVPPVHNPNAYLFSILHTQGRLAITGYADPQLDKLIEEQSVAEETRADLIRDMQRRVMDNAVLFMPVGGTSLWAWQPRVEGFAPNFSASEYFYWASLRVKGPE